MYIIIDIHMSVLKSNKVNLKKLALQLRKSGYSYSLIVKRTGVAKSTLSYWFRKIEYRPNKLVLKRIKESVLKSSKVLRDRKIRNIKIAKDFAFKELGKLSRRDLWLMGMGLYLGEGAKNKTQMVRIMNSDPEVVKFAIVWFKEICGLETENLRLTIHTYPDLNVEKTLKYWSNITGIPRNQFRKTHIDYRKGKSKKNVGKSPYGTAHVTVHTMGKKENGVFLFRRIMGWIESAQKQTNLRV